jgi:hemerythrin superfamily protein
VVTKSRDTAADPIHALEDDHREVEGLFERLAAAKGSDARRKAFVAIRDALALHATLEEGVFYPAVMTVPDLEALDEVSDAVEDHGVVKGLLAEIESTDPAAPSFLERCAALRRAVSDHVQEEEGTMFPRARKLLSAARRAALGERMSSIRRAHERARREARRPARSGDDR